MAKYYICLDIGGTKVLGAVFNEKREIVHRLKKKTKASGDDSQNIENTIISVVAITKTDPKPISGMGECCFVLPCIIRMR